MMLSFLGQREHKAATKLPQISPNIAAQLIRNHKGNDIKVADMLS